VKADFLKKSENVEVSSQLDHKVCMLVFNNFTNDSRVQKEAETLIQAGCEVTVLALLDNKTRTSEERNGIRINRVQLDPWHLKILRLLTSGKFFIAIAIAIAIVSVEILLTPDVFDFFLSNKILCYSLLALLIIMRKQIKGLIGTVRKQIKGLIHSSVKALLMPFHRHFCFLSFYKAAVAATAGQHFTIYHAHDLNTLPAAYYAAKRDKAKLVYDSHELYVERNKLYPSSGIWKFILRRIEGFFVHRSDAVFTVNETLAGELARRYNIPMPKVIMNAPARFTASERPRPGNSRLRNELAIPEDKKCLLYVGGITFNRGLEELIQSLVYLPDCYLVYMGYGTEPYKQTLQAQADEKNVAARFAFFGPVPTNEVILYAAGADLGVAPIANACMSYYCCSPNKLFEYMNAGLPVIASNFPEMEKVVLGHNIGLTFDPADPKDIAETARQILDDPKIAKTMRENAFKASAMYNWENEAKKLLQIYRSL
jgi:glycosyltransferase involved in cell wall biosynthesis